LIANAQVVATEGWRKWKKKRQGWEKGERTGDVGDGTEVAPEGRLSLGVEDLCEKKGNR
jgi:hypothetical protein